MKETSVQLQGRTWRNYVQLSLKSHPLWVTLYVIFCVSIKSWTSIIHTFFPFFCAWWNKLKFHYVYLNKIVKTKKKFDKIKKKRLELLVRHGIFSLLGYVGSPKALISPTFERETLIIIIFLIIPFVVFVCCLLFTYLFISFCFFVLNRMSVYSIIFFQI